jgi:AcrR family transcriptional regulator
MAEHAAEGLRERKKRQTRQLLSDTATELFLAKGFDAVTVSEIAAACGVSEKTVFNYFPAKEALIMDRLEATVGSLRTGLADLDVPPVEAVLVILDRELAAMTPWLAADHPDQAREAILRFGDLIRRTPSLRAYQSDMMDQFAAEAARILAERAGMSPADPEPQIAARALLGLWHVQAGSLRKHLASTAPPAWIGELVSSDVRRAADLLSTGLGAFPARANARLA